MIGYPVVRSFLNGDRERTPMGSPVEPSAATEDKDRKRGSLRHRWACVNQTVDMLLYGPEIGDLPVPLN